MTRALAGLALAALFLAAPASADENATSIGIAPEESVAGPFEQAPEIGFDAPHREWARMMEAGLAGRKAYP